MPPPTTLKARAVRTAQWTLVRVVALNVLQLVQFAALSRILEPRDFGEVSLVLVLLTVTDVFTKTGIDEALVRERGEIGRYLDAAWTLQALRGLALAGVVLLLAPVLAAFQGSPGLLGLAGASALVPALDGLRSMGPVLFSRTLAQGRLVAAEVAVGAVCSATGILLALCLRSAWAIVLNQVLFAFLKNASTFVIHAWRPRPTLRLGGLAPFARFGLYFNLASGVSYAGDNLDRLLVGRLLGLHPLGLYDRASSLSTIPRLQLMRFLTAVAFPGFSLLLESPERFRACLRRYLLALAGAAALLPLILFPLAGTVVALAAGPKFQGSVPLFRILILGTALHGFGLGVQVLFNALGKPQYNLWANLTRLAVLLAILPAGIALGGLEGACLGVLAADASGCLTTIGFMARGGLAPRPASPVHEDRLEESAAPRTAALPAGAAGG